MSYSIDERFNQIDEAIEELATGGTPDVLALYLTKQEASSTYLTQSNASSTYLTHSDIENEYLPLSAGANHPITGDTYIEKEDGTTKEIIFTKEGDRIGVAGTGNGDLMYVSTCDANNVRLTGMQMDTTSTTIFSNNGYVTFRPKGKADSTNEVTIDTSGWMNGKGFHADAINSDQVNRIGDMFIYRKSNISGGAMTAGTLKTVDTITQSAYRPNADVDTGFAFGYNGGSVLPLRYGYVRIKSDGSVQISPNESVANSCYWTIIAIWRNPNFA